MKKIAAYLTSFESVALGLLLFSTYRYFEVQFLFYRYLPLPELTRLPASIIVAFVVVFSLLIFSSHLEKFKVDKYDSGNWIKVILFLFTLFVNAFFWEVWLDTLSPSVHLKGQSYSRIFKFVIVVFFACFDFAYNHLFISIWQEQRKSSNMQVESSQLQIELSQLQQAVSEARANLSQIIAKSDPRVCPRCGKEFDNSSQRNGHLRSCQSKTIWN